MNEATLAAYKVKRHKKRIIVWSVLGVIITVLALNALILPATGKYARSPKVESYSGDNRYVCFDERPLISAHRAGGDLAPEETMMAFEKCMTATEYSVDIVEFDLHITADSQLVLLHDDTLNRTSNATSYFGEDEVKAEDKTLAEIKELNFGENFQATDGSYPYRNLRGADIPSNVKILSLDEILTYLTSVRPNLNYIIEIKNGGDKGEKSMDILFATMERFGITENTVVGTFKNNVTKYIDKKYPSLTRSASIAEVLDFYYAFLYGVKTKNFDFEVLQIPVGFNGFFDLATPALIDFAHYYGIAVQYWTINSAEQIKCLVDAGADAIITDNPETAYGVIFDGN